MSAYKSSSSVSKPRVRQNRHKQGLNQTIEKLSADFRYNNFPWQTLTEEEKQSISESADAILQTRAAFPDSTLEQLYKPELMPSILVDAHRKNDRAVAKAYGIDLNLTDEEIALILMRRSVEMSRTKPKRKKRMNKRSK